MSTYLPPNYRACGAYHKCRGESLIRVLLGVLIVAFAIVLGVVIIYRAFHAVHPAEVNHPTFCVTSSTVAT
jgi:hypothetical protein